MNIITRWLKHVFTPNPLEELRGIRQGLSSVCMHLHNLTQTQKAILDDNIGFRSVLCNTSGCAQYVEPKEGKPGFWRHAAINVGGNCPGCGTQHPYKRMALDLVGVLEDDLRKREVERARSRLAEAPTEAPRVSKNGTFIIGTEPPVGTGG
jgi:hypothetical protein